MAPLSRRVEASPIYLKHYEAQIASRTIPVCDDDDTIPDGRGDVVSGPIVENGIMGNDMTDDQLRHDIQGDEVGGTAENEVTDNTIVHDDPVLNGRPKRDRKQNVRYSSEEYDLSKISSYPDKSKLTLSSIFVQQSTGKLMKKRTNSRI